MRITDEMVEAAHAAYFDEVPDEVEAACMRRAIEAALAAAPTSAAGCSVHNDALHGEEAEELRSAIERLQAKYRVGRESLDADDVVSQLQQLLDEVDARDSHAFLERKDDKRSAAGDDAKDLLAMADYAEEQGSASVVCHVDQLRRALVAKGLLPSASGDVTESLARWWEQNALALVMTSKSCHRAIGTALACLEERKPFPLTSAAGDGDWTDEEYERAAGAIAMRYGSTGPAARRRHMIEARAALDAVRRPAPREFTVEDADTLSDAANYLALRGKSELAAALRKIRDEGGKP